MDENYLVSIITPLYNSEKYIGKTIESVQAQTYTNWEMIIVDDCSKDNSIYEVKQYLDDPRIQLFHMDTNSGGARARNRGLEHTKGRFVTFIDADDMWKPNRIEKQLEFTINNGYAFTYSGYEILKENGNKIVHVPPEFNYGSYMKNTSIAMMTVMLDLGEIKKFKFVDIKKDHDSMTWAGLFRNGYMAYGHDESLAYYRKVTGSISNNKLEAVKNHWKNCRNIEKVPFFKCCYYFSFYIFNAIKKNWL